MSGIYRQLLVIALASRREAFDISANPLSQIRRLPSIKRAHRLVGIQNTLNHIVHDALPK
jgi:hypothetical protein